MDSKGRKQESNGTGWIRNETEWNRLDPKQNRMEPVRSEMEPNSTQKTRKQNRIGFGILVSKPKKTGIELNFRFYFSSFFHSIFNLCDCERRGDAKPQNQPPLKIEFFNLPIVNPRFSSRLLFELDDHSIFWL